VHHARETLRQAGYRLTPQRTCVWEVVRRDGRHLTAEQIAAEVRATLPETNLSTVYRTLELLVSLGLVFETRLSTATTYYEVAPEPVHHHFVCERCGAVGHFSDDLLAPLYAQLRVTAGFAAERARATVFGLCHDCLRSAASPTTADSSRNEFTAGKAAAMAIGSQDSGHVNKVTESGEANVPATAAIADNPGHPSSRR